jgi:signal transduction histidine kinase
MTWRIRSVRKRILLLALVPLLSLFGLYVFATSITARNAINLARADTLKNATGEPTGVFAGEIQAERLLSVLYLAAPTPENQAKLAGIEQVVNHQAAALRSTLMSGATMNNASVPQVQAIDTLLAGLKNLPGLQAQITARSISRPAAMAAFNVLVGDADQVLNQTIRQETNSGIVAQGLAFVRIGRAGDLLSQENAIFLGDLSTGTFPAADRRQFTQLVGARRYLVQVNLPDLDPAYRGYYTRDVSPLALGALTDLENKIMAVSGPRHPPAVSPAEWAQAVGAVTAGYSKAGTQSADALTRQASNVALSTNLQLIVTGGIGLFLVIVSIVVAILTARSLVRELGGLRQSALALANERLPDVVDRLALGQEVDASAEAPDIPATSAEIAQVRDAFTAVQQTAVRAAIGQARLRQGMSDVFRNLARRSQSLLHRQLALLDAMERRARDPQELEDLFRIDHLTTRMRRHAESLIILSGHSPARGWRNPVPLIDVLRAAVAEVEDYTRIRATSATGASLAGPAVGDVIHMIAELAENATMFSPPNTPVVIHGDTVGRGFAVEIEDRGLGLSDEQLQDINERLENPPPFDPASSDQLGLFVAGQLAKRHNIKVSLKPSPYGGTTAIVLIPQNLVVPEGSHAKDPAAAALTEGALRFKGRHALEARPDGNGGGSPAQVPTGAPAWAKDAVPGMQDPADTADLSVTPFGPVDYAEPDPGRGGAGFGDLGGTAADGPLGAPVAGSSLGAPVARGPLGAGGPGGDTVTAGFGGGFDNGGFGEASLPRRVRQASLAPQLREPATEQVTASSGDDFWTRSPEDSRSTMAAMQQGWERGRSVFDVPAGAEPSGDGPAAGAAGGASPAPDTGTATAPEPGRTEDRGTSA